jgi:NAD(P)-dependent dehydrogenase (short-subunit alcohol dehydrogenase family)
MTFAFAGKVAAVTGGASGIGLALAERLAAEGCHVAVADVHPQRLAEVRQRLPGALTVAADVADPRQVQDFADRTVERFGAVHLVCANAGIIGPAGDRLWEVTDEEWRQVIGVNLLGVVATLRAFVPLLLRAAPGHVGITASMAAVTTTATMPAYYATKHALLSVADTLHRQFVRDALDLGVSVLLPAQVTTNLGESLTGVDRPGNPRGIGPAEVADRFVEAVQSRRLHVFTHAGSAELARARTDALLAEADRTAGG